jgi:hypothetical protein
VTVTVEEEKNDNKHPKQLDKLPNYGPEFPLDKQLQKQFEHLKAMRQLITSVRGSNTGIKRD